MKKVLLPLMIVLSFATWQAKAQDDGISQLLKAAPGDASKLIGAYADPLFKGLGYGLNNGWTNTAKTKSLLRFDLRITASGVFVPTGDKSFDVTKIGLSNNLRLAPGSTAVTPTIGGKDGAPTSKLEIYSDGNNKIDEFQLPERVTPIIPAPQVQLTVGLVKSTDVTLRLIPTTKFGDNSVGMIGFGLKHNVMNDFFGGVGGKVVPFDLAIAAGYSRLSYKLPLDVRPSGTTRTPDAGSANRTDFTTQRLEGHFSALNVQAIISKKLLFFTPFAAIGYSTAKTDIGLYGNYPVSSSPSIGGIGGTYTVYTDPVTIKRNSVNDFKLDAGFQLDLAFFKFYASGSLAKYKSVTAGIGFGI